MNYLEISMICTNEKSPYFRLLPVFKQFAYDQGSELNGQKVVKNGEKNLKMVNKRNLTEN